MPPVSSQVDRPSEGRASFEKTGGTLELLKILALGDQEVAAGKIKPAAEIVARLRAKRATD
jgi:hypothetical protein